MSEYALKALEKAKAELVDKKTAHKSTLALLQQVRANIKIKERTILLLEKAYKEAVMEENGDVTPISFTCTGPNRVAGSIF
jgi:hypothetical protein